MHFNNEILKQWRQQLGLTQEQLGRLMNIKQNTISQWESGAREPDSIYVLALAELFNKSIEQIYTYSTELSTYEAISMKDQDHLDASDEAVKQAWSRFSELTRAEFAAEYPGLKAVDLRKCLYRVQSSINNPNQVIDLSLLPPSLYKNVIEAIAAYLGRCVQNMEHLERIDVIEGRDLTPEDEVEVAEEVQAEVEEESDEDAEEEENPMETETEIESEAGIENKVEDENVKKELADHPSSSAETETKTKAYQFGSELTEEERWSLELLRPVSGPEYELIEDETE